MLTKAKLIGIIAFLLITGFSQIEDEKEIGNGVIKAKVMGELNLDYVAECEISSARLDTWHLIKVSSLYDLEEFKFSLNIVLIVKDKAKITNNFKVLDVNRACKEKGNYAVCLFSIEGNENFKVDFEGIKGQVKVELIDEEISLITFDALVREKATGKVLKIKNGVAIVADKNGG